jgi:uncharacterized protein YndB with AHSA1/START domain
MLKTIVRVAGALIVLLILLAAVVITVGYALPQDHVASARREVSLPAADVFARIMDVERHPEWRKDVERVDVVSKAPLRWREHSGGDVITFEMVEALPHHRVVTRIADPDLPFGGTWIYELRPEGAGTGVTITERGEVYNPVFRFMSRFVLGHTATMERVLDGLAR